jgi:hypothetical protein
MSETTMPKMSAIDLKALLSAERYDALSAMAASKLSDERAMPASSGRHRSGRIALGRSHM